MTFPRATMATTIAFVGSAIPSTVLAAENDPLNLVTSWPGLLAVAIFAFAYLLVALEEITQLSKSKPVVLAAGLIWLLIAAYVSFTGAQAHVEEALTHVLVEFASLFLFLLVAMTYVNAMTERQVFDALRSWLASHGFSFRQLFWITGFLAFLLSPFIDNLTTALVMVAVVLAVGQGNAKFISLSCINIVVGANAGGAFSPFGDITTLMVWQAGALGFTEFFRLLLPAIVNFIVPAAIMYFAVPRGAPKADLQLQHIRRGGWSIVAAFALTIATAVLGHSLLGLPPYFGMMLGLAYLQFLMFYLMKTTPSDTAPAPARHHEHETDDPEQKDRPSRFNIFTHVANADWDTLLFFYGVLLCVGGLGFLGYLAVLADAMYLQLGATWANIAVGLASAVVDNIPIMAAVIQMNPAMSDGQWLLVTLTAGVGGSLLSVGSAAGVALMGPARGFYTFISHMKWSWAIGLGYIAAIATHIWINAGTF